MIWIEGVKKQPTKEGKKETSTFSVKGLGFGGDPMTVKGWRYFHEEGKVGPPSVKAGKFWMKTSIVTDKVLADIALAFKDYLRMQTVDELTDSRDVWDTFLSLKDAGDLDEVMASLAELPAPNQKQQTMVMLLEVFCNPKSSRAFGDLFRPTTETGGEPDAE